MDLLTGGLAARFGGAGFLGLPAEAVAQQQILAMGGLEGAL
jgi:hypothetical protein